jgi:hypothetical protein
MTKGKKDAESQRKQPVYLLLFKKILPRNILGGSESEEAR